MLSRVAKHNGLKTLHLLHKRRIFLSEMPTFDKNPALHVGIKEYNASIDILTLAHWVDIQYFEQNKLDECNSLHEWIDSKSPTHILLDICPNRLEHIYSYNQNNPKPDEITTEEINEILESLKDVPEIHEDVDSNYFLSEDNIRSHFHKLKKQTKKMKRFLEKVDRIDEINKLKLITSANKVEQNKVLNQYKLTEPMFTEVDIWYFEFYWNIFETYFSSLIPHFDEFKREFYLNTVKFRFLNVIYGEEILIALNYFDPDNTAVNDYNDAEKYKYAFPKMKGIHSRNQFDEFMDASSLRHSTLSTMYENENGLKMIAGGMPIEFMQRKMQKLKKPMLWIEFAMAIKNYFSDKHAQNLANQVPLICDIKEFIWTPYARKTKYNSWDSTIELHDMIECVIPRFYEILLVQQSEYLFNNLIKLLQQEDDGQQKNIVILTGQGVAQLLNQHIYDFMRGSKEKRKVLTMTA